MKCNLDPTTPKKTFMSSWVLLFLLFWKRFSTKDTPMPNLWANIFVISKQNMKWFFGPIVNALGHPVLWENHHLHRQSHLQSQDGIIHFSNKTSTTFAKKGLKQQHKLISVIPEHKPCVFMSAFHRTSGLTILLKMYSKGFNFCNAVKIFSNTEVFIDMVVKSWLQLMIGPKFLISIENYSNYFSPFFTQIWL